ncbi:MAG: hypothetical protein ACTSYA_04560 [Candidatus Kariarchaeaceae archaeon]
MILSNKQSTFDSEQKELEEIRNLLGYGETSESNFRSEEAIKGIKKLVVAKEEELGKKLDKFRNAKRVNIFSIPSVSSCLLRKPWRILKILQFFERYGTLEYGLEVAVASNKYFVHFVLNNGKTKTGIWYFNYKKSLGVNKILQIARILEEANLDSAILVANQIGPNAIEYAKKESEQQKPVSLIYYSEIKHEQITNY